MRRFGKFAALFTAIAIAFTGCNAPNESAPELSAAPTRTAEAVPAAETAERETDALETKETAETLETVPAAVSADGEKELVTYSEPDEGHVFVDFDYIKNAEGITDPKLKRLRRPRNTKPLRNMCARRTMTAHSFRSM